MGEAGEIARLPVAPGRQGGICRGAFGGGNQGRLIKPAEAERIQTKTAVVGLEVFFLPGGAIDGVCGTGIGFLTAVGQAVFFWGRRGTTRGVIMVIIGEGKELAVIAGYPLGEWCHGGAGVAGFVFKFVAIARDHPTGRRIVVVNRCLSFRTRD